ncbi:AMP-binding protein [uncultured Corynebacterium sp.]|uniref:AMP-binding protein n=1 Tax=uncultured Corynebacterium sp. TaxID=159447 RepID=UPI0025CD2E83|nr:AMP-binding protein [uncultured Corynebacterium sp.]
MTPLEQRRGTPDELLIDFIDTWADKTPDAGALRYGDRSITWSDWRSRIHDLAGLLTAHGIGRGDRVAFLDRNHPVLLDLVFAAASIGAAAAVLNWRYSLDEVRYALEDSGAHLLIAGEEFAGIAAELPDLCPELTAVILLDDDPDGQYETMLREASPVPVDARPDDTALVIYSSGTTGRPKGVVLNQRSLVAHTRNVGQSFPFDTGDVNLVAMPFFHVGGVCYAFFGIREGVDSIILRNPDGPSLIGALHSGATHAFLVPPVIKTLLEAGAPAHEAVAKLKILGYGASPTPLSLLRNALDTWPGVGFVQVYGQTELCGVVATLQPQFHRDPDRPHLLLTSGRPVPEAEVRVLDTETGEEVPVGTSGELCFRSPQIMDGYLNHPDATAQTVVDGWIHTGDIGRVDGNGFIYCEDRLKDMIITGGENVYGPEVERVLLEHPAVDDAAVIGIPDPHWVETVKAVVVLNDQVPTTDIIAFTRERLAGFKCPRSVDVVDELPRNASGKILKRDLRAPYLRAASDPAAAGVHPGGR